MFNLDLINTRQKKLFKSPDSTCFLIDQVQMRLKMELEILENEGNMSSPPSGCGAQSN